MAHRGFWGSSFFANEFVELVGGSSAFNYAEASLEIREQLKGLPSAWPATRFTLRHFQPGRSLKQLFFHLPEHSPRILLRKLIEGVEHFVGRLIDVVGIA